jgi:hypothetical protein
LMHTRWMSGGSFGPCSISERRKDEAGFRSHNRGEFVYWDDSEHQKAREERDAARWRRVSGVLD